MKKEETQPKHMRFGRAMELYSTTVSTKNEESQRSKQQRWKCERNNLFLSSLWL